MNEWIQTGLTLLGSIAVALIAAAPGLRALKHQDVERKDERKKLEEEITQAVLQRAHAEIAALSDKVDRLELENARLYDENSLLRARIDELERKNGE